MYKKTYTRVLDSLHLSVHKNTLQRRSDTWNQMKLATERLQSLHAKGEDVSTWEKKIAAQFKMLETWKLYWELPGLKIFRQLQQSFERQEYSKLSREVAQVVHLIFSSAERYPQNRIDEIFATLGNEQPQSLSSDTFNNHSQLYFAVLFVENDLTPEKEKEFRHQLARMASPADKFIYKLIIVSNFEDALAAVMLNHNIQCCILGYDFPLRAENSLPLLFDYMTQLETAELVSESHVPRGLGLGEILHRLRPELDLYLFTNVSLVDVETEVHHHFRRVFYNQENYLDVHLSVLQGIGNRYETPFFDALKSYSQQPTGVFHAMPISRGNSIFKSDWIQDMGEFYGKNIFLAETSATSGGLDSLLNPTGSLKQAQSLAAKTFGARQTFFVTNGTSTANKIVLQAIVTPGDTILIDQNCHKSHHYSIVLTGAYPV